MIERPSFDKPSAAIIGGGIAGLAAAIALRRVDWSVTLYEQASLLEPLGAAISLWPNAITALDSLGVDVRPIGQPIVSLLLARRSGGTLLGPQSTQGEAVMVLRSALQQVLLAKLGDVRLVLGRRVSHVAQDATGARVDFADGSGVAADLVIDASGVWSAIATRLLGTVPEYCGYGGVLAVSDPVAPGASVGQACEYWGMHDRFGVLDLQAGRRYWFYMRNQSAAAPAPTHSELTDLARDWPVDVARAVRATPPDRLIPVAIHARAAPQRLGRGRILCLGDAAHAMEPNLGQGACQALEDAVALSVAARQNSPDAVLGAVEAMRLWRVTMIARHAARGGKAVHGTATERAALRGLLRWLPRKAQRAVTRTIHTMPAYR